MKNRNYTTYLALLGLAVTFAGVAKADLITSEQEIPVEHVFAPKGFDNNDSSQIIVSGMLPNLCFKNPKATATVDGQKIRVRVTALHIRGGYCAQMFVPFTEVAEVGVVTPGNYSVEVTSQGSEPALNTELSVVAASSSSIDDFVYAHVDWIETFKNSRKIVLHGYNPSDCFELDTIEMISNNKDTYSILPIMKQVRESCPRKQVPFAYEADVPLGLSASRILLHTRITNGKSVNALFFNVIED